MRLTQTPAVSATAVRSEASSKPGSAYTQNEAMERMDSLSAPPTKEVML